MAVYVVTSTWYSEPGVRADLALETARSAVELGYVMIVVDGGKSYQGFQEAMEETGAEFYVQEKLGMDAARLQGLLEAYERVGPKDAVVWMEPEKVDFVRSIPVLVAPILSGRANMAIPIRKSMSSYPPVQRHTETAARLMVNDIVGGGIDLDEFFGPFAIDKRALKYVVSFDPEKYGIHPDRVGWLRNHAPRLEILADSALVVREVKIPYIHPCEQTKEETGVLAWHMKRITQLDNLIPALWLIGYELGLTDQLPPYSLRVQLMQE